MEKITFIMMCIFMPYEMALNYENAKCTGISNNGSTNNEIFVIIVIL